MNKYLIAVGSILLLAATTGIAQAQVPTFNKEVAPILYEQCAACHRAGEVAPMSLITYKEVRPWARAIKAKVVARQMPPWFADMHSSSKFRGGRVLMQAEIDTLAAWADAGAPEGTGPAPAAPKFPEGSNALMNRPPDYILESPDTVDIPATGQIPGFSLWAKTPFTENTFFEAVELRPTNRAVTHHVGAYAVPLPAGGQVGPGPAWKGGPTLNGVYTNVGGAGGEVAGVDLDSVRPVDAERPFVGPRRPRALTGRSLNLLATYAPAGGFFAYEAGSAKRIGPDNNYISWNLHYTGTGKPEKGKELLMLWKHQGPVQHEVMATLISDARIVNGQELLATKASEDGVATQPNIRAYEENYKLVGMTAFDSAVTITNLWPHMHLRGKSMHFIVTYPDGREETILNVPKYQFDWQLFYSLKKPMKIPAGSVVRAETVYDNSNKNRVNPSPATEVVWGGMSWEEMHFPFVEYTVDDEVQTWSKSRSEPATR